MTVKWGDRLTKVYKTSSAAETIALGEEIGRRLKGGDLIAYSGGLGAGKTGARPGARREIVEAYIKRLNDLEQLAMSYPGVTKTYAIQAGRELRVIVGADKIDDKQTESLSGEIAKKIQDEMTYPGQVKITVIRETRAVSFAK